MSNNQRRAILPIAAIAGAQLINVVLSRPQPAQSSSCLQWASEAVGTAYQAIRPTPQEHIGYYDVRLKRDVEINAESPTQPTAVAPSVPTRSAVVPETATTYDPTANSLTRDADRAIDQQIAASQGQTLKQYYAGLQSGEGLK